MKTLFVAYRVTDLDHSLAFYTALGYIELGRVQVADAARIAILKSPDEPVATLELVHRPGDGRIDLSNDVDHLAIQVNTLTTTLEMLPNLALSRSRSSTRPAPTARRRRGSPTPTVTGSSS